MNYIYEIILLLTLLKSIVLARKFNLFSQNYLFVYLLITFLVEILSQIILLINPKSEYSFQYDVYCVFCILFFWFFYSKSFQKNLRQKVNLLSSTLIISTLLFSLFPEQSLSFLLMTALPIFYILYSMLWFLQKITLTSEDMITDDPIFWISSALLLWSCFFIFRVIPRNLLNIEDKEFLILLRGFLHVINCIMYILFFKALIKYETIAKKTD